MGHTLAATSDAVVNLSAALAVASEAALAGAGELPRASVGALGIGIASGLFIVCTRIDLSARVTSSFIAGIANACARSNLPVALRIQRTVAMVCAVINSCTRKTGTAVVRVACAVAFAC